MWENEEDDGVTGMLNFSIFAYSSSPRVHSPLHPAPIPPKGGTHCASLVPFASAQCFAINKPTCHFFPTAALGVRDSGDSPELQGNKQAQRIASLPWLPCS